MKVAIIMEIQLDLGLIMEVVESHTDFAGLIESKEFIRCDEIATALGFQCYARSYEGLVPEIRT